MKKSFSILLVICLLLSLVVGCSANKSEPDVAENGSEEAPKKKLKVALLLPGTYNDNGWNASAYAGLKAIESKYDAEVSVAEKVPQSDIEEVLRSFAEEDYNIIFGHGFQYGEPAIKLSSEYPNTIFAINSTRIFHAPNVAGIETSTEESGYFAGALAALESKSNKIFAIGGLEIPTVQIQFEYYIKGAKSIKPDIEVKTTFIGNGEDATKAKELAEAFMEQGFDVGVTNANQASLGVYDAIKAQKKARLIGLVSSIESLLPDHAIGSVAFSYPQAMMYVTDLIQTGNFEAQYYNVGVKDGGIIFTANEGVITPEHKATIDSLIKDVSEGKLNFIE